jgi:hypothetical protein
VEKFLDVRRQNHRCVPTGRSITMSNLGTKCSLEPLEITKHFPLAITTTTTRDKIQQNRNITSFAPFGKKENSLKHQIQSAPNLVDKKTFPTY